MVQASGLRDLPSESVFSDDRRYVERSAADISRKVTAAHHTAQQNCTVNNMAKQEYTVLRFRPNGEIKRVGGVLNVERTCTTVSRAALGVVGIPVQPGTYLPSLIPKILGRLRPWRTFTRPHRPNFPLALRALYAYVQSSLDFVCRSPCCRTPLWTSCSCRCARPCVDGISQAHSVCSPIPPRRSDIRRLWYSRTGTLCPFSATQPSGRPRT